LIGREKLTEKLIDTHRGRMREDGGRRRRGRRRRIASKNENPT
jgi:hypothetical protein